jgi:acyl dehydratase
MTAWPQARLLALAEVTEGLQSGVDFSVTPQQMRQFAELSGDFNPLHTDETYARRRGFDGVVVYGGLLIAKVSQLIGMHLPGRDSVWASVSLDFRKPLYVDQAARIEGTVTAVSAATGLVCLKLTVRTADAVLAKGSAEVILGH